MKAIVERSSVRQFDQRKVSEDDLKTILKAGFCAPSCRDLRPWHFVVIQKQEHLDQLSEVSLYSHFLKEAAFAIVCCADLSVNESIDYCQQDLSAATENMLIQAKELGIGSCWIGCYPYVERVEKLRTICKVPKPIMPLWTIAFGYPKEEVSPKEKWDPTRVHIETF